MELHSREGGRIVIREDQEGLWLEEAGEVTALGRSPVSLPAFEGHPQAQLLRVLHHELLINI
nr:hypothetical protein [Gemmatimonadales bacterium]